ncbi:DNA phosphorothioation-associated protein 4 [Salimicrobium flavidum]|uniref:Dnd system-associated protein 4 n=1 Tax=Salimicrobium flavidum TaxID=570947 RepID=A0A1N7KP29_9BACI|nr:DNA phosphorothioation-associated protein 4 [Salimicrobium flavidum]SIS63246.1 dnd system-associated protein 4 [Salimicrobium flavidum]
MVRRRIRRPKKYDELYKELTDQDEYGIFETYKDVFMNAGILGYLHGEREEFNNAEQMNWSVFNLDTDEAVINMVVYGSEGDDQLLNNDDDNFSKKMTVFEEYAANGVNLLYDEVFKDRKSTSINNYQELIMSYQNEKKESTTSVKDIKDLYFY